MAFVASSGCLAHAWECTAIETSRISKARERERHASDERHAHIAWQANASGRSDLAVAGVAWGRRTATIATIVRIVMSAAWWNRNRDGECREVGCVVVDWGKGR